VVNTMEGAVAANVREKERLEPEMPEGRHTGARADATKERERAYQGTLGEETDNSVPQIGRRQLIGKCRGGLPRS